MATSNSDNLWPQKKRCQGKWCSRILGYGGRPRRAEDYGLPRHLWRRYHLWPLCHYSQAVQFCRVHQVRLDFRLLIIHPSPPGCFTRTFCLIFRRFLVQGGGIAASFNRCDYFVLTYSSFWFKDGATIHTSNASLDFLQGVFGDRLMTGRRRGGMEDWPANSPDLSPADYWFHGYLKVASIEY